jgi:hypothetical protein
MRVPPALLLLISSGLLLGWLQAWGADQGAVRAAPWWIYLFLVLMSVAMVSLAAAVTIDPRPLVFRRALAGTALAWTVILASVIAAMRAGSEVDRPLEVVVLAALVAVAAALVGLGMTTATDETAGRPDWIAGSEPPSRSRSRSSRRPGSWSDRDLGGRSGVRSPRAGWIACRGTSRSSLPSCPSSRRDRLDRHPAGKWPDVLVQAAANRRNSILMVITLVDRRDGRGHRREPHLPGTTALTVAVIAAIAGSASRPSATASARGSSRDRRRSAADRPATRSDRCRARARSPPTS